MIKYNMLLLANGDSNTYGYGLSEQETNPHQWPRNDADKIYALTNSWPAKLAEKLQCDHANLARPGSSNDRIVRTTMQYLAKHGTKDTVLIIGWTEPSRREVHVDFDITRVYPNEEPTGYKAFLANSDEMQTQMKYNSNAVSWAKEYRRFGWDEVESYVRYFQQILLMQNYCEYHSIPYVFFCLDNTHRWMETEIKKQDTYAVQMTKSLYDAINWKKFAGYNRFNLKRTQDAWQYNILHSDDGLNLDETAHPTLRGHEVTASKLRDELETRNII